MDNAIEACLVIDKDSERKIKFSMITKEGHLLIQTINTKSKSVKVKTKIRDDRFTTKKDQQNHGLGLGNIEFVVMQYKGTMDIEDIGTGFLVKIKLPMIKKAVN